MIIDSYSGPCLDDDQQPPFCEELGKNASVAKKLELLFHTKTHNCRHKSPDCVTNAVQGLISNFKIGLKIRLAVTLLQVLLRGGKIGSIKIPDQLRFPCFLSLFAFLFKMTLCVLRRFRGKDDGMNGFLSGVIGGLAILIHKDKGTKHMFALYLLSRAYGSIHKSFEDRGYTPMWENQHLCFIILVNVIFIWQYFNEFNTKVPQSWYAAVNNLYTAHGDKNDLIMRDILQRKLTLFPGLPKSKYLHNIPRKAGL